MLHYFCYSKVKSGKFEIGKGNLPKNAIWGPDIMLEIEKNSSLRDSSPRERKFA